MKLDNFREISGDQIESNIECFFLFSTTCDKQIFLTKSTITVAVS